MTDDIPTPPVIGLSHDNHEKIHRPIPIHMSAIREKSNHDDKEDVIHRNDEREKDKVEVNQNYKPFVRAQPATRDYRTASISDEEEHEEEEDDDDEEGTVRNRTSTSLHGHNDGSVTNIY